MRILRLGRCLVLPCMLLLAAVSESCAGWDVGSTYHLDFINFPVNGSADVTLDLTTKLVNTNLTVTETIYNDGPDSQWIDFRFATVDGGPLASNLGAQWRIDISNVQTTEPMFGDAFYTYWSVDGEPVDPIFNFGAFGGIAPIPTDPGAGSAYVATGFPPYGPLTEFAYFAFVSPYNFVSSGGIDPSTANDFHGAIHIFSVPEPTSLAISVIGASLLGSATTLRRRRSSRRHNSVVR